MRLDVWEKGNISPLQLSEKLRSAVRHALCDAVMEFRVLPAPLCMEAACPPEEQSSGGKLQGLFWVFLPRASVGPGPSASCVLEPGRPDSVGRLLWLSAPHRAAPVLGSRPLPRF